VANPQKHFFCIDNELVYWNFFLDFGPLNLGQTYRFCALLNNKLSDPRLKDKVIYFYSATNPQKRANAVFLLCAWGLLCLDKQPEDAFAPFKSIAGTFPPWVSTLNVPFMHRF
jgi:cell division cycle 14